VDPDVSFAAAERYDALLHEIRREFPDFRLMRKDCSPLSLLIDRALRILTFGAQRGYLDCYQTTIGSTVYVTPDWDQLTAAQRYITMRHERVHLRQFRRYTRPGMALLYLFVPLPAGLAWFRAHFEKQGYAETIRAAAEVHGITYVQEPRFRGYVIEQFMGGAYGWMWPFRRSIERWYDAVVRSISTVEGGNSR
jgi:hypothetical protein